VQRSEQFEMEVFTLVGRDEYRLVPQLAIAGLLDVLGVLLTQERRRAPGDSLAARARVTHQLDHLRALANPAGAADDRRVRSNGCVMTVADEQQDRERREADQCAQFQQQVLAVINDAGNPFVVLYGLFELTGALAAAMIRTDPARGAWVLGMLTALTTRVEREATAARPVTTERPS
jgi:hypothetical protein